MVLRDFPNEESIQPAIEMRNANPLRDYELVEMNLLIAWDQDSGKSAVGHSEREALDQMKAICSNAINVQCRRARMRRRRQPRRDALKGG